MCAVAIDAGQNDHLNGVHMRMQLGSLRYLGFIEILAGKAYETVGHLYNSTKESKQLRPLKQSIDLIEEQVKTAIHPILANIGGKPHELLLFVDRKVDSITSTIDYGLLDELWGRTYYASDAAKYVSRKMFVLFQEIQKEGIGGAARSYYFKHEVLAQQWSSEAWKQFVEWSPALQNLHFTAPATTFSSTVANYVGNSINGLQVLLASILPHIPSGENETPGKMHTS
ncbi:hypothetical protein KP509_17G068200 [Ceratopteris richardii]|uniref:Uncharacterized protein n=1 Tax=Ceratopteris richardii TaxID=49495 RepID=A0A8T2SV16_CERRI|nr:hypothetical protein KP509_17G068200 [Ceratopteris richardii]